MKNEKELRSMFNELVKQLKKVLPDLGRILAVDSKAVNSAGKSAKKNMPPDGRRDTDANWGKKSYKGRTRSGKLWEKTKKWFGYKIHLIADAVYELPLYYDVTRANVSDGVMLLPMMKDLKQKQPEIIEDAEYCDCDRGYDSEENNRELYDSYKIKPVIGIRRMWKDGEKTRVLDETKSDNIVYDENGGIYCVSSDPSGKSGTEMRAMVYDGFEEARSTLKYRCPARFYGFDCPELKNCGSSDYGRVVRVNINKNRRLFTPLPRNSVKWLKIYNKRTAVERINSRLDVSFGFERHYIRGIKKMKMRNCLALIVMLSMALGSIMEKQPEKMRSLVWSSIKAQAA